MLSRYLLLLLCVMAWQSSAYGEKAALNDQTVEAELVWIVPERDNHQIRMADYDGEEWQPPRTIHQSENALSSPAMVTNQRGVKTLIFSELYKPAESRLLIMTRSGGGHQWSTPATFSTYGKENLGANILIDLSDTTWVFWSANNGGLDDIVYSKSNGASWSTPQVAHPANDVPDFQAQATLNDEGEVNLAWKTFDFSSNQYIRVDHTFTLDNVQKTSYKTLISKHQDVLISDIALPSYVVDDARTIVHFPNNRRSQSMRLGQSAR